MFAIYRKELRSYFTSIIGNAFIGFLLLISGILFVANNLFKGSADFTIIISSSNTVIIFLVPILTMRLIADERHQKTDQLLLTSPVKPIDIVLGKYFAVLSIFFIGVAGMILYPVIMSFYGKIAVMPLISSFMGFILIGASIIAIGMFISSITESQVIAAILTFVVLLFIFMVSWVSTIIPQDRKTATIIIVALCVIIGGIIFYMTRSIDMSLGFLAVSMTILILISRLKPTWLDGATHKIADTLLLLGHYKTFDLGILDLSSIIYYLSVIVLFIFLTIQSIQKRRWS